MDTRNNDIRFFMGSSSKHAVDPAASFYQAIVRNLIQGKLAETQVAYAVSALEQARSIRRFDIVDALSTALAEARLPARIQSVGLYFKGLVQINRGELLKAYASLDRAAAEAVAPFSSRATLSIGAVAALSSEPKIQKESYIRALQSTDPFTLLHAHKMIAVLEAVSGNHRSSIGRLEGMFSFARSYSGLHPQSYYDYLNSLAVEMAQVGRLDEARNVCCTVLASPLARLYPECHETRAEIEARGRRASRSIVTIGALQAGNVLDFRLKPAVERRLPIVSCALLNFPERAMNKKRETTGTSPETNERSLQEKQKEAVRILLYDNSTEDEAVDTVLRVLNLSPAGRRRLEAYLDKIAGEAQDEKA